MTTSTTPTCFAVVTRLGSWDDCDRASVLDFAQYFVGDDDAQFVQFFPTMLEAVRHATALAFDECGDLELVYHEPATELFYYCVSARTRVWWDEYEYHEHYVVPMP